MFTFFEGGGGIPNERESWANEINDISECEVPMLEDATNLYQRQGGRLTIGAGVGPLADQPELLQVRETSWNANPSYDVIFGQVCGHYGPLQKACQTSLVPPITSFYRRLATSSLQLLYVAVCTRVHDEISLSTRKHARNIMISCSLGHLFTLINRATVHY